jgi:hypothetical protein
MRVKYLKYIERYVGRIVFLAVVAAVALAIVFYQKGYYDFIFITRTAATSNTDVTEIVETSSDETVTIAEAPLDNGETTTAEVSETAAETAAETTAMETVVSAYRQRYIDTVKAFQDNAALLSSGWKVSEADYNSATTKLALLTLPVKVPVQYTYRTEKLAINYYDETANAYRQDVRTNTVPVLRSYMGYILMDEKNGADWYVSVFDSAGKAVYSKLPSFSPGYTRDENGNPIFIYGGKYCYFENNSTMMWSESDFRLSPALFGSYSRDYGQPNAGLSLYYDTRTGRYGYVDADGNTAIYPSYYFAADFSPDGLAVVADADRKLSVIDTYGRVVINSRSNAYLKSANGRYVYDQYTLPAAMTSENIGMMYFDKGWLRVRAVTHENYNPRLITSDTDKLINAKGVEFNVPSGYEIAYYADGVLTLKKDKYYGCFTTSGKWIAQPVYTYAGAFNEGLCVLMQEDGKTGMIDTNGNVVMDFVYDSISDISGGVITAYEKNNGWTAYTKITEDAGTPGR